VRTSEGLQLRDASTGKLLRSFSGIHSAFSPDGQLLAITTSEGSVEIWPIQIDSKTAKPVVVAEPLKIIKFTSSGGVFRHLTFTPDGRHLVTANANGTVYVLRLKEWLAK
jgi:WD40 repeat protein